MSRRNSRNNLIALILFFSLSFSSCENQKKFNRQEWLNDDLAHPERDQMVEDLLKNYKIVGSSFNNIVKLLGDPSGSDSTGFFYELSLKYDMIDPIAGKNLIVKMNKDSIVTSVKVAEWKKN